MRQAITIPEQVGFVELCLLSSALFEFVTFECLGAKRFDGLQVTMKRQVMIEFFTVLCCAFFAAVSRLCVGDVIAPEALDAE